MDDHNNIHTGVPASTLLRNSVQHHRGQWSRAQTWARWPGLESQLQQSDLRHISLPLYSCFLSQKYLIDPGTVYTLFCSVVPSGSHINWLLAGSASRWHDWVEAERKQKPEYLSFPLSSSDRFSVMSSLPPQLQLSQDKFARITTLTVTQWPHPPHLWPPAVCLLLSSFQPRWDSSFLILWI